MVKARLLFRSLRPQQWMKNGFILIPLIFAQRVFHGPSVLLSLQALFIFCILSSAIYLINDINDLEADRRHPEKRHRPLAAGLISTTLAKVTAVLLLTVSLLWGAWVGRVFLFVLAIYLTVQLLYNYRLKEIVILDIFCVSSGFFLRVTSGAVAIGVSISHWLIICTVFISIFLALAKRRHELVLLGNTEAGNHRKALSSYSPLLLDQMMGVITASTLLSYMLYCVSPETIEKFQTDHLIYTFPFVLYGIFRYLYLVHIKSQGGAPEKILVSDLPMAVSIILWGLFCVLIIYGVI
jgi:4-hydroxybenzoate polyprenyltransferase